MRQVMALLVLAACGPAAPVAAPGPEPETTTVWLYTDAALVHERRWIEVEAGESTLALDGLIAPPAGTLWVRSLTAPQQLTASAVELPAGRDGAEQHVGAPVRVVTAAGTFEGVLAAADGKELTVRNGEQSQTVARADVQTLDLGAGAALGPRLHVRASRPGRHLIEVVYETGELSWAPEYFVDAGGSEPGQVRVTLQAAIDNRAGVGAREVELVLYEGSAEAGSPGAVWRGDTQLYPGQQRIVLLDRALRPGRLEAVYRMQGTDEDAHAFDASAVFWRLGIEKVHAGPLPAGPVTVQLADGEQLSASLGKRVRAGAAAVLELGRVPGLIAALRQVGWFPGEERIREQWEVVVTSRLEEEIEIRIEDPRPVRGARIERARPAAELVSGEVHTRIEVPAGGSARALWEISYPRYRQ